MDGISEAHALGDWVGKTGMVRLQELTLQAPGLRK